MGKTKYGFYAGLGVKAQYVFTVVAIARRGDERTDAMKTVVLLCVLLPSLAFGQVDSLKESLQYYPLQVGDYWEYQAVASNSEPPFEKDSSAYSIQVVGDIPNSYATTNYESGCLRTSLDTILGVPSQTKDFGIGSLEETSYTLAKGFGISSVYVSWDFGRTDITLVYARIDGKGYGTQIPDAVTTTPANPRSFGLSQNYPNPFNPSTTIRFELQTRLVVTLKVYDVLGRQIGILVNRPENVGVHSVTFYGSNLPSGVYFYRLEAGTYHDTKKLLLLK